MIYLIEIYYMIVYYCFSLPGVISAFLLADYPDLFGQVVGTLIWLCVTLVLIILFLHLVYLDNSSAYCCT